MFENISISSPYPTTSQQGNTRSLWRFTGLLSKAGFKVTPCHNNFAEDSSTFIALNAWRSADVIKEFKEQQKKSDIQSKLVVVLTGSDIFPLKGEITEETYQSIELADAVIMTSSEGRELFSHNNVHEIRKSIKLPRPLLRKEHSPALRKTCGITGVICAHLREQKNPFLQVQSLPLLSDSVLIEHYGSASDEMQRQAIDHYCDQYKWYGEKEKKEMLNIIQQADFLLNTSHVEGSSNALYEALALGTLIIASDIRGNIGVLGKDYPGLFKANDPADLARVVNKFCTSESFRSELAVACQKLTKDLDPSREQKQLINLIKSLHETGTESDATNATTSDKSRKQDLGLSA